ncbi:hypothetical protein [Salibacterium qingdaonense]|uniref:Uncharacterized protein n=1 Tax=Salibacterium qingdaonense TaxID=266892 RepID=A0A1I4KGV1_9BACI|nr:hypothetical protein [Salibacterium qingdaonense]SFL78004.1 hypothetical protein SAMN04488054_1059 [Salibacterium qingdaonense]
MGKNKKNIDWSEAKKRCCLTQGDIHMAKELGMTPKSLVKNIPSPSQSWKAPVKVWVRDLYEEKFGKVKSNPDKGDEPKTKKEQKTTRMDENLPF